MKRAWMVAAGGAWFLLVFLVSFRLTFPSGAVADRIRHEVSQSSGGTLQLDVQDLKPWWVGASASNIRLFQLEGDDDEDPTLTFAADSARIRVGLGSLLRQTPTVSGAVELGAGQVDFVVGTRLDDRTSQLKLGQVELNAKGLPLTELAALAGASMEGRGALDIDVSLQAPESMREAKGRASIRGRGLMITKLDLSDLGVPDLGLEIPVDDLDLTLDIADGKAQVVRGLLRSELATLEITGDLTLRDDLARSAMNLEITVGNLGPAVQMFKSFLGSEWSDGRFHYRCTGPVRRGNCRAERERAGGARGAPARASTPMRPGAGRERPAANRPGAEERPAMDEAARAKRREELRERLRTQRSGGAPAVPVRKPSDVYEEEFDEEEEYLEEDEEFLDEEYEDEEDF